MNNSPLPNLITYNNTINYADGSESKLLSVVSDPNFDEFTSWRAISDWAQYYHLSPLRRNLLNWINFGNEPLRILELGAGCGAITSFLVTIPSSDVIAVEGALDRARVIRFRCKNANNLQIHACPINEFIPENTFDIITLVGVLEYAGCYETAKDPFNAVLSKAADMLSKDGILIVAIENQLGCKYISGCPEDHYGVPYEGLNGYPNYNGIKTFTLKTLSQNLIMLDWIVRNGFILILIINFPVSFFQKPLFGTPDLTGLLLPMYHQSLMKIPNPLLMIALFCH